MRSFRITDGFTDTPCLVSEGSCQPGGQHDVNKGIIVVRIHTLFLQTHSSLIFVGSVVAVLGVKFNLPEFQYG